MSVCYQQLAYNLLLITYAFTLLFGDEVHLVYQHEDLGVARVLVDRFEAAVKVRHVFLQ